MQNVIIGDITDQATDKLAEAIARRLAAQPIKTTVVLENPLGTATAPQVPDVADGAELAATETEAPTIGSRFKSWLVG